MTFQDEEKLLSQLKDQIDQRPPERNLAAFDADGTLWPEDANDILLHYEIKKGLRDFKDLLTPYYQSGAHRHKLCALFAQRQAGFSLKEFKFHCREALKDNPLHPFPFQKKLLGYLKQQGFTNYIVTASMKWLVEIAVELYELPIDKVLGVETELEEGTVSSKIIEPAPVPGAKGQVLLKSSQGESCFLAGGNTLSDIPLLEIAEVSFVVHSALPDSAFFSAEEKLKERAVKNNWNVFQRSPAESV